LSIPDISVHALKRRSLTSVVYPGLGYNSRIGGDMSERDEIIKMFFEATRYLDDDTLTPLDAKELAVTVRRVYEAFSKNPELYPEIPPELIESIGSHVAKLEKHNIECDIADQNLKIAIAKRDRTAAVLDSILADPELKATEH
jgi:hypothetical protein